MENIINVTNDKSNRKKILGALYEIKVSLSIRRFTSKTIKRSEFKNMLEKVESKYEDVRSAISDVFDEFFQNHNSIDNKESSSSKGKVITKQFKKPNSIFSVMNNDNE